MPDPTNLTGLRKSPIFRLKGLKDGLIYPNPELSPENCIEVSNIDFSELQVAANRKGKEKFNTSQLTGSEPLVGFFQADYKAGSQIIYTTPTRIYTDNGTTRKEITGSLSPSGSVNDHYSFAFIDDKVIATNGVDLPFTWNGDYATPTNAAALTFSSDSTQFTKCKDVIEHRNTLVVLAPTISGTLQSTRILWADVDTKNFGVDITRYLNSNRYEIGGIGSSPIVGGVDNWEKLYIMKTDGVYPGRLEFTTGYIEYVPDLSTGAFRGFSPIAKSSFIARPEFVFGIALEGAFIITKDGGFQIITNEIDFANLFNKNRLQHCISTVREDDHQIRTLISSATNTTGFDQILVFDYLTGDISIEDYSQNKLSWIDRYEEDNTEHDFHASHASGYVYKANTGIDDDGDSIDWTITTAPNDLGLSGVDKTIHSVVLYYRDIGEGRQSIELSFIRDQGARSGRVRNIDTFGATGQYDKGLLFDSGLKYPSTNQNKLKWGVNRSANNISMKFSGNSIVKLIGYQVYYTVDDTELNTPA
jgi:hypothetical protein